MTPEQKQLASDRARVAKLRIEAQNGTAEWCADLSRVCDLADIALDLSEKACRELREDFERQRKSADRMQEQISRKIDSGARFRLKYVRSTYNDEQR